MKQSIWNFDTYFDEGKGLFTWLPKSTDDNNVDLYNLIYDILIIGKQYTFEIEDPIISHAAMFGIVIDRNEKVAISNRIFEIRICNYFISKDEKKDMKKIVNVEQNVIIELKKWHGNVQHDLYN